MTTMMVVQAAMTSRRSVARACLLWHQPQTWRPSVLVNPNWQINKCNKCGLSNGGTLQTVRIRGH